VQHADVKLLAILQRVDSKTLGVEELLVPAAVLAGRLVALGHPAAQPDDNGQLERESDEWVDCIPQKLFPIVAVAALRMPAIIPWRVPRRE
jgi:hypothetical protein